MCTQEAFLVHNDLVGDFVPTNCPLSPFLIVRIRLPLFLGTTISFFHLLQHLTEPTDVDPEETADRRTDGLASLDASQSDSECGWGLWQRAPPITSRSKGQTDRPIPIPREGEEWSEAARGTALHCTALK
jgi:hypothetical protein